MEWEARRRQTHRDSCLSSSTSLIWYEASSSHRYSTQLVLNQHIDFHSLFDHFVHCRLAPFHSLLTWTQCGARHSLEWWAFAELPAVERRRVGAAARPPLPAPPTPSVALRPLGPRRPAAAHWQGDKQSVSGTICMSHINKHTLCCVPVLHVGVCIWDGVGVGGGRIQYGGLVTPVFLQSISKRQKSCVLGNVLKGSRIWILICSALASLRSGLW